MGWLSLKRRSSFGVNLEHTIVTNGVFVVCAEVCAEIELLFGVVSGSG